MSAGSPPLLEVEDLTIEVRGPDGATLPIVRGVSFEVADGEVLGIVGESGSGKTMTLLALLGLLPPRVRVRGAVRFRGRELLTLSEPQLRKLRGAEIAVIFQDPMSSLNPVQRVGDQVAEQLRAHRGLDRAAAGRRAVELLARVGIPDAEGRARSYPHELSGGMRQRVMIAAALSCEPSLLLADEPTTALDVTVQAEILALLSELTDQLGAAVVLISHDLGVIAKMANRIAVMYAGDVVEEGASAAVFANPQHPYAWGLLGSIPQLDGWPPTPLRAIPGQPPTVAARPSGCPFRIRCAHAFDACVERPELLGRVAPDHRDRCHLAPAAKAQARQATPQDTGAAS
jgi:oligopeptide/dipeptide ABC transporter ATP-binding protein